MYLYAMLMVTRCHLVSYSTTANHPILLGVTITIRQAINLYILHNLYLQFANVD